MESPTNAILTGMAVSDLLVIASYIPYVIHNYIRTEISPEQMYNYGWAVFTLFHAHNTVLFHTISIWLTVLLAVWRYITVRWVSRENFRKPLGIHSKDSHRLEDFLIEKYFCLQKQKIQSFLSFILKIRFSFPSYFFSTIKEIKVWIWWKIHYYCLSTVNIFILLHIRLRILMWKSSSNQMSKLRFIENFGSFFFHKENCFIPSRRQ